MSYNFDEKDYGSYFESLERQLNKPSAIRQTPSAKPVIKRKRKIKNSLVISFLAIILVASVVIGVVASKPQEIENDISIPTVESEKEMPKISFSFAKKQIAFPNSNDAKSAVIIDLEKNQVISSRNPHERLPAASTIKIMTLLVALENIEDKTETFTMTYAITDPLYVAEASVAGFLNEETITVEDMLYGLILPSGADAAMGLAIKCAGSEEAFVKLMNKKAKELGLKNTNFTNASGLHHKDNYSSAYDMAIILAAAMENEEARKILETYQYTTSVTPQHNEGILLSSTLFSYMYGTEPETATILGGKTGFVNEAGYCIASFGKANENKNEYIAVTLGNSSRWPAFYGQIDLYKEFAQ